MGKGDKKSRRGKIWRGSYGISRPRKKNKPTIKVISKKPAKAVVAKVTEEVMPEVVVAKKPVKKAPVKKAAKKKAEG